MSIIRFLFVTVLFAFCGAITLSAKLRYDAEQGVFYSENAPRNVDQDEYDDLVEYVIQYYQNHPDYMNYNAAQINYVDTGLIAYLNIVGSPAALRFIYDLKELVKDTKRDLKRINS